MAQRIRTIKPELSRHEVLFEAVISTELPLRFAFVMLLTCCDREGRFRWQPRVLKLDILPYDHCDFECVLDALWRIGLIECYEHQSKLYGCIPTWHKHQRVNQKEPSSVLPPWSAEGAAAAQRRLLKKEPLGFSAEAVRETAVVPEFSPQSADSLSITPTQPQPSGCVSEDLEAQRAEPLSATDPRASNPFKLESMDASTVPLKIEPALSSDLEVSDAAAFCGKPSLEGLDSTKAHAGTCQAQPSTCLGWAGKGREEEVEQEREGKGREPFVARDVRPRHALEPLREIFEYWKTVMHHPGAHLDPKRQKLIRKALEFGYSVEALCEAIRGCSLTPHNQGHNDRGQRYDGLHIILRDSDQIDRFIHNAKNPPRIQTEGQRRLQGNVACLEAWLDEKRKEAFHA
ncbi:MAG: hypothetical protein KBD23_05545 [Gammaproteobacteria bacterium]|nr:hypothetical protein [Gammaproteobacteria bacterium]